MRGLDWVDQEAANADHDSDGGVRVCHGANRPGEAARILEALRDANVNLFAFSGFPQGHNRAQIDIVTDNIDGLKATAKRHKCKLSRIKRAFLVQGADELGAALPAIAKIAGAKINVIAADAVAAGEGRFGMLFWVCTSRLQTCRETTRGGLTPHPLALDTALASQRACCSGISAQPLAEFGFRGFVPEEADVRA